MAYTYADFELQWWQQPVIYSTGHFPAVSPQDDPWPLELPSNVANDKNHFQPQPVLMPAHLMLPHSPQEVNRLCERDRSMRFDSPAGSQHSSTFSESSISTEHALAPGSLNFSARAPSNANAFGGQHSFGLHDIPTMQHTLWQPPSQHPFAILHSSPNLPSFAPSSHTSLPLRDLEMVQHDEDDHLGMPFDDDMDHVHSKSPIQRPQPEELKLSEVDTESDTSSIKGFHTPSTPTETNADSQQSDDEDDDGEEDEEDAMPIDNDSDPSDPDYDNRPTRRRAVRASPKTKPARKSSNNTVISPNSRVRKSNPSSSAVASVGPTMRVHSRRPSKGSKGKGKGPTFASRPPLPKSDRMYPCTFHRFGCNSEFPNKNEWKRHVACQHLQLGYYRCDLGDCNPDAKAKSGRLGRRGSSNNSKSQHGCHEGDSGHETVKVYYNDFNRKDLFTQHCRRMHGPSRNPMLRSKPLSKKNGALCPTKEDEAAFEDQLENIRARCWHVRRRAPNRSLCGFCSKVFDADYYESSPASTGSAGNGGNGSNNGEGGSEEKAWEERMEHVGRHYEKEGVDKAQEDIDEDLVDWGLETGVLRRLEDGRPWLVTAEVPTKEDMTPTLSGVGGDEPAGAEKDKDRRRPKARRQPSRTVVLKRRVSFQDHDDDSIGE